MLRLLASLLLTCGVVGCGQPARPPLLGGASPEDTALARAQVVRASRELTRAPLRVRGVEFDADPVGYLRAAYWTAGIDLFDHDVATDPTADGWSVIERSARLRGQLHRVTPRPGDLALFRAANGRLFMAAIVTDVADDGVELRGWFSLGPDDARIGVGDETRVDERLSSGTTLRSALAGYIDPFR